MGKLDIEKNRKFYMRRKIAWKNTHTYADKHKTIH